MADNAVASGTTATGTSNSGGVNIGKILKIAAAIILPAGTAIAAYYIFIKKAQDGTTLWNQWTGTSPGTDNKPANSQGSKTGGGNSGGSGSGNTIS